MTDRGPFRAVVADMDGVITRTAAVHARAWKSTFDAFLRERALAGDEPEQEPFSVEDYRQHVDGKPRYDGVRAFLASRGIELPEGAPGDPPERETVHGLGNRKNDAFRYLLAQDGVEVFADSVAAFARWRRGGLPIVAISSTRNCRDVLRAAGLLHTFDGVVDGKTSEELGLGGKPGIFAEAARRLDVDPRDAIAIEDATAGVRAALEVGYGLVVGVDRLLPGQEVSSRLEEAGAHVVVRDLTRLRFRRAIPRALERQGEIVGRREGRKLAVFLDFDGTLSPIVEEPGAARLAEGMRPVVERLAERLPVAIVSGRDRPDVEPRVGVEGLFYAGSHGLDISGPGRRMTLPEAEAAVEEIDRVQAALTARVGQVDGVVLERKRFSLAVHYRMVDVSRVPAVLEAVDEVAETASGLRRRTGKMVVELEPDLDWDKGHAVAWIREALGVEPDRYLAVYIGDDETDEDAFRELAASGVGVRVGPDVMSTLADYRLADPDEVRTFLEWLADEAPAGS